MKIGNAAGFWGDSPSAALELIEKNPDLDFINFDYLAELSLSIMAAQKEKNPELGYAADFVEVVKSLIPYWEKGLKFKLVANAGGLNPEGLKAALEKLPHNKKIVSCGGDNVLAHINQHPEQFRHLETGEILNRPLSHANAYLGADKIVQALKEGADIVITGRTADPSLTVGPAIYYYGWKSWDEVAQATIAGHLLECGAQVTGGISNQWDEIAEPWNIPFPVVQFNSDSSFLVKNTKVNYVKEQLLYELGDPARYLSPDCTVNLLHLKVEQQGPDVSVKGAIGSPPPPTYKVSASYKAGYKTEGTLLFSSEERAKKGAEVILKKVEKAGFKLNKVCIETFGNLLRLAAMSDSKPALEYFSKQFAPLVTAGPPGTSGYTSGRSSIRPVYAYWPCLIERRAL